ncbi:methyltransferase family protein [Sphingomonas sp.]|uniref:methyltransferase family protein n=1 Tax=Sphingomonas sp. TaxID=28214 RepID=UPI003B003CCC
MTGIVSAVPVGLPGLAVLATGFLIGALLFLAARGRRERDPAESGSARAPASIAGIVVQGLGFAIAGIGPILVTLDPMGAKALGEAALIAALLAVSVGLFGWASRTMGRDWSLRARTRADHRLVRDGPFRYVRHPIYSAMLLYLVALAIAYGHPWQLLGAIPVYVVGTLIRTRSEERLLREMFGSEYETYAAKVKRFVPGLL